MAQNSIFTRASGAWSESPPGKVFARSGTTDRIRGLYVRSAGSWKNIWNFFLGSIVPDSDIETTNWTPTPLYLELNEDIPDDATTEITADFSGSSEQIKDFEVGLSNPIITPTAGEVVTMRVRSYLELLVGNSFNSVTMELKQGTTVKASRSQSVPDGYITVVRVLSQAEKDSITDWDNLRVRVEFAVTGDDGSSTSKAHVTWIELEFS